MMAAVPVGSNALIFSQRYETLPAETSTAIVVSTLAFVASAPLWLALLHAIGWARRGIWRATRLWPYSACRKFGLDPHGVGPLVESVRSQEPSAPGGVDGPEGAASLPATAPMPMTQRPSAGAAAAPRATPPTAEPTPPVDVPLSDPQRIEFFRWIVGVPRSQARPGCRTSSSST